MKNNFSLSQQKVNNLTVIVFLSFVVFIIIVLILGAIVVNRSEYNSKLREQNRIMNYNDTATEDDSSVSDLINIIPINQSNLIEFELKTLEDQTSHEFSSHFKFLDYLVETPIINSINETTKEITGSFYQIQITLSNSNTFNSFKDIDSSSLEVIDDVFDGNGLFRYKYKDGSGYIYTNIENNKCNEYTSDTTKCANSAIRYKTKDNKYVYLQALCLSGSDLYLCDEIVKNIRIKE